jgi:hypothetical protein
VWGAAALICVVAAAAAWFYACGYILYYGDAQAHLNISRSLIDSRTPGYEQLGSVWLPVLHLICLPLVGHDWLWRTGLAGTIPVALCLVAAGTFFYLAAREAYGSAGAAGVVLACLVLNPNVLYLASAPMTEIVFLAGEAVLLWALLRFRASQRFTYVLVGVAASWWMSLCRYDGWFLIPFEALWLAAFAARRRWVVMAAFGALASAAPLYWVAHNWWETGNALDFFNGPYSAKAIQGAKPYPGWHDWGAAVVYYAAAGELCAGVGLSILGAAGVVCAAMRKTWAPVLFLLLTPVFYVWSMHSAGNPIFVPQLWPHGYYNSRYGIALVVLAAFAAGAIVPAVPVRWKKFALAAPLIAVMPWLVRPSQENWICWKESEVNSVARRAWTAAGAEFFAVHYREGQGILMASGTGDVSGILCRAGISLREALDVGNGPAWMANETRPELVHEALWAVGQAGDPVTVVLERERGAAYRVVHEIRVEGAPALEIYRRQDGGGER